MGLWSSPLWRDGFTLFLSIVVQALPFLMLGVMVSGFLAVFVDERQLSRWLPRHQGVSSVVGGALGFFFPVCECGNLPVARRLVIKGVPPHVAIAFLLAAPVFNPVVIIATWIAFRQMPELVVYRVALSFTIAVVVGWIFSTQENLEPILHPGVLQERQLNQRSTLPSTSPSLLQGGTFWIAEGARGGAPRSSAALGVLTAEQTYRQALEHRPLPTLPLSQKWDLLVQTWIREICELGGVLVMGATVAAAIQTVIPRSVLLVFGQGPVISVVVMMALAAIISICSTVDSFFALAFVATFTPGSLLAFLVFGPMIDLKAIGLMMTLFKPRVILYLILLTAQFALIPALIYNFFGT